MIGLGFGARLTPDVRRPVILKRWIAPIGGAALWALLSLCVCLTWLLLAAAPSDAQLSRSNRYGTPSGAHVHMPPIGWVLVIPGGGWQAADAKAVARVDYHAKFFRAHGWGTYDVGYRAGEKSLPDVLSAYDALRKRVGSHARICAWGTSAGGNLALLLASWRPTLACVISEGGPTDLFSFPNEAAWAPPGVSPTTGPTWLYNKFVLGVLGRSNIRRYTPVLRARKIRAKLLLGASTRDALVPQLQMWEMWVIRPDNTRTMLLDGSTLPEDNFTHGGVTPSALARWQKAELELIA